MAARRDRVDLADLKRAVILSDLVRRRVPLVKRGGHWWGCCPFHKEKSPSFEVRDIIGTFHCFGCGAHGDVVAWMMQIDGMTFPEALSRLGGAPDHPATRDYRQAKSAQDVALAVSVGHWSGARALEGSMVGEWLRYAYGIEGRLSEAVRWREDDWAASHQPPLVAKVESDHGMTGVYDRPRDAVVGSLALGCVRLRQARPLLTLTTSLIGGMWIAGRFSVPCWAALSSDRLAKVQLPEEVTELVIFASDSEWSRALDAADRHETTTRSVTIERLGDHINGVSATCD